MNQWNNKKHKYHKTQHHLQQREHARANRPVYTASCLAHKSLEGSGIGDLYAILKSLPDNLT